MDRSRFRLRKRFDRFERGTSLISHSPARNSLLRGQKFAPLLLFCASVLGPSALAQGQPVRQPSGGVGRERSLGSGVIVDPDGYIITNFHVVKGADRVRVVLTPTVGDESQPIAMLKSKGRILNAQIVGVSKVIDLAVLKVDATGLPTLPLGRYDQIHKGQVVLDGLHSD